ncbi:MAG TPA: MFS transporter [Bryobacteraceae bacterium]|nr:MFS transporter [Bryobacteraceae bacterium]
MSLKEFRRAGHAPTLASAFLYFDVSFMVWVILGPLGPFLGEALKLSAAQKGFLTAVPLLGGSFFRILLGLMTERIGGRRTGLIGLSLTLVPLLAAWQWASSFGQFLAVGLLLGIAGASFAAALPLASGWYPPEYQGLAMGIAGAGNSGTLLATLFAPRLAQALGWRTVFGIAIIPVCLVWLFFAFMAKDAPVRRPAYRLRDYAAVFAERDTAWFCFIYAITFGGFSGLSSYLSIFYHDQYGLTKVQAGDLTTLVVLFGSFLRPVGGLLSDRIGGVRMLQVLLGGVAICLAGIGTLPPVTAAVGMLILTMASLGMSNGAVFQLVPQRFPTQVGMLTGIIGAAGGLGGFLLPSLLGSMKQATGSFGPGFRVFAVVASCGLVALLSQRRAWRRTWPRESVLRAGLAPIEDAVAAGGD